MHRHRATTLAAITPVRFRIKKDLSNNVSSIQEEHEKLADDPYSVLTDLGTILARKLANDSGFLEFCKQYGEGVIEDGKSAKAG